MVRYRRRIDIIADVLSSAANGATKKTRIMYNANLSYTLLKRYLAETVGLGLLRFNNGGYEVTEKGFTFLRKYEVFSSRLSRVRRDMEMLMAEFRLLEDMCSLPAKTSVRVKKR